MIFAKSLVSPLTADGAAAIIFASSDSGMSPLQDQLCIAYDLIVKAVLWVIIYANMYAKNMIFVWVDRQHEKVQN